MYNVNWGVLSSASKRLGRNDDPDFVLSKDFDFLSSLSDTTSQTSESFDDTVESAWVYDDWELAERAKLEEKRAAHKAKLKLEATTKLVEESYEKCEEQIPQQETVCVDLHLCPSPGSAKKSPKSPGGKIASLKSRSARDLFSRGRLSSKAPSTSNNTNNGYNDIEYTSTGYKSSTNGGEGNDVGSSRATSTTGKEKIIPLRQRDIESLVPVQPGLFYKNHYYGGGSDRTRKTNSRKNLKKTTPPASILSRSSKGKHRPSRSSSSAGVSPVKVSAGDRGGRDAAGRGVKRIKRRSRVFGKKLHSFEGAGKSNKKRGLRGALKDVAKATSPGSPASARSVRSPSSYSSPLFGTTNIGVNCQEREESMRSHSFTPSKTAAEKHRNKHKNNTSLVKAKKSKKKKEKHSKQTEKEKRGRKDILPGITPRTAAPGAKAASPSTTRKRRSMVISRVGKTKSANNISSADRNVIPSIEFTTSGRARSSEHHNKKENTLDLLHSYDREMDIERLFNEGEYNQHTHPKGKKADKKNKKKRKKKQKKQQRDKKGDNDPLDRGKNHDNSSGSKGPGSNNRSLKGPNKNGGKNPLTGGQKPESILGDAAQPFWAPTSEERSAFRSCRRGGSSRSRNARNKDTIPVVSHMNNGVETNDTKKNKKRSNNDNPERRNKQAGEKKKTSRSSTTKGRPLFGVMSHGARVRKDKLRSKTLAGVSKRPADK